MAERQTVTEIWIAIPGYEGRYEVSNAGRIRSMPRRITYSTGRIVSWPGRILSPYVTDDGHLRVNLHHDGKRRAFGVHVLVALAFHGPGGEREEVRHLNGNPADNQKGNLAWGTRSQNQVDSVNLGTHPLSSRQHCGRHHEYTPDNTLIQIQRRNGREFRVCRACKRENNAKRRAAA